MAFSLADIFKNVAQFLLPVAKKSTIGYIERGVKSRRQQGGATKIEVPERSPLMSVNYKLPEVQIQSNIPSVAGYAQYKELYYLYAQALGEIPSDVLTRESFEKISPGGTRITSRPQYRQGSA